MDLEEPITTQEGLDAVIGSRLERERKKFEGFEAYKQKAEAYDALGIDADALERLRNENKNLKDEAKKTKAAQARAALVDEVASATGVSRDIVSTLAGADKDALTAQAQAIATAYKTPSGVNLPEAGFFGKTSSKVDDLTAAKLRLAKDMFNTQNSMQ